MIIVKNPNGSISKYSIASDNEYLQIDCNHYDADGYYNAAKSRIYNILPEDWQQNLESLNKLGFKITQITDFGKKIDFKRMAL